MLASNSRRILSAFAVVALLGLLLAAAPAYAAVEAPPVGHAGPAILQVIGWAAFQGMPSIVNGKTDYWAWNDNVLNGATLTGQNVLHIRATTDGSSHKFTGTVTAGWADNFYNLAVVNGGGADSSQLIGYNRFTFSLTTASNGDGVDVEWSGTWLSLDLSLDDSRRPAQVLYGSGGTAARRLPLTVLAGQAGLLTMPLSILDGGTEFQTNLADGYFFYRDSNGYHLRLTSIKLGDRQDYEGTVLADGGRFAQVKLFKSDPRDHYMLFGGRTLDFRFLTNGLQDGLDWQLTSGGMIFTLRENGQVAAPQVWLGSMWPSSPGIPAFTFRLTPSSVIGPAFVSRPTQ